MLNNIARIQRALTQAHLDAILLTDENDRRFATGFPSSDGAVIVTVHQAFFITDARYIEAARAALTGIAQVLLCSREAPMRTLVQGILREANVQILGGEEQTTSYAEFTAYETGLCGAGGRTGRPVWRQQADLSPGRAAGAVPGAGQPPPGTAFLHRRGGQFSGGGAAVPGIRGPLSAL